MVYFLFFLAGCLLGVGLSFILVKRKYLAKEAEFSRYQDLVANHFEKTADLFAEIQVRQDNLVLHLQEGAKRLRGGMVALESYAEDEPKDYTVNLTA